MATTPALTILPSLNSVTAGRSACAILQALDPDRDGTLDLNEAKYAASTLFDKLDKDHGGTLSANELKGYLSKKELDAGDPDKDGTLTKEEYLAIVEARFTAADSGADRTIDCKEANSKAGHELLHLLSDPGKVPGLTADHIPDLAGLSYRLDMTAGILSLGTVTQIANIPPLESSLTATGGAFGGWNLTKPLMMAGPPLTF